MDCTFDYGFCKWNDDPNDWKLKWIRTSLKLIGFGNGNEENSAACLKYPEDAVDETLTSRLFGPAVLKTVKLGCLSFKYRISDDSSAKLTLMRREMGYVMLNNFSKPVPLFPKYMVFLPTIFYQMKSYLPCSQF